MQDEIFGPIFPLITYKNLDEAIEYIQAEQEKPLVVYYFGKKNGPSQKRVENETSSGSLVVNETIFQIINTDLPFGGVGHSGQGRYHGISGFKAFSNEKSVLVKPTLDCFPFNLNYPPYTPEKQAQVMKYLNSSYFTQAQFVRNICLMFFFIIALIVVIIYLEEIKDVAQQYQQ